MNFLDGELRADNGGASFSIGGVRLPLDGYAFASGTPVAQAATLGARPEHVLLDGAPGGIASSVEMIEPMGAESLVWSRIGDVAVSVRIPSERQIAVGDTVSLSFPAHRLSLFSKASGARL